jgi:UrcA family protein
MQRKLIAAIASAAILAFATAAPASAGTTEQYEARISYADLNLHSEAGADAFLRRVHAEARATCGDSARRMPLQERRAIRACTRDFESRAVAALDDSYVSTRFAGNETRPVILAGR